MTKTQRSKLVKTINIYRDQHTRHFRDTRWLRHMLSELLPKHLVEKIVWDVKFELG